MGVFLSIPYMSMTIHLEPNISLKADVITCYSTQVPLLLSSDGIVKSNCGPSPW